MSRQTVEKMQEENMNQQKQNGNMKITRISTNP